MDTVLGVSMAPTTVRIVLVEGQNADGATVDEDNFAVANGDDPATFSAPDQVVAAILGTREGASEAGYDLLSTGVTWSDQCEAAELRDALAARKVENVMLVSAFLAAAALAQSMGSATGYARAALLYVEPDTATLAVVDTTDGSITDVKREQLPDDDDQAVATLVSLVSAAEGLDEQPDGLLVVGSGVDIPLIKPALEEATSLPLSVPEQPATALARGAALASANAPLFASSTAAQAYALDPGTGSVSQHAHAPGYLAVAEAVPSGEPGAEALAYSAVADDSAAVYTQLGPDAYAADDEHQDFTTGMYPDFGQLEEQRTRKSHTVFGGNECADHFCRRRDGTGDFAGVQHPTVGQFAAQPQPQRGGPGQAGTATSAAASTRASGRTRAGRRPGRRRSSACPDTGSRSGARAAFPFPAPAPVAPPPIIPPILPGLLPPLFGPPPPERGPWGHGDEGWGHGGGPGWGHGGGGWGHGGGGWGHGGGGWGHGGHGR